VWTSKKLGRVKASKQQGKGKTKIGKKGNSENEEK